MHLFVRIDMNYFRIFCKLQHVMFRNSFMALISGDYYYINYMQMKIYKIVYVHIL